VYTFKGGGSLATLNIKGNRIGGEGKTAMGKALAKTSSAQFLVCDEWSIIKELTSLDFSSKKLNAADAVLLAGVIGNNGTARFLNLADNLIGQHEVEGWAWDAEEEAYFGPDKEEEFDPPEGSIPRGFIALASAIGKNCALSTVNLSNNALFHHDGAPAGNALSDMLGVNTTLTELDVSSNAHSNTSKGGPSFLRALCVGLKNTKGLSTLHLRDNTSPEEERRASEEVTGAAWEELSTICSSKGIKMTK
jgi:hypothetical protein